MTAARAAGHRDAVWAAEVHVEVWVLAIVVFGIGIGGVGWIGRAAAGAMPGGSIWALGLDLKAIVGGVGGGGGNGLGV
jgi:hypothetical protein